VPIFEKEKRCSKCGAAFGCGGLPGCWCRDVTLDAAALAALRQAYADCLCPSCLKAVAAASNAASAAVTDASVTEN
jgi:hypothetical protein